MSKAATSYPSVSQLRKGVILASIAHAIWIAQHPNLAYEQSWDGDNYSVNDSQGCRGTVTFRADDVVGVFRDENSSRSPFRSKADYDLDIYFKGMPPELHKLAQDEALQYVLDDYHGETVPLITAAFWSRDGRLTAAEPWDDVVKHGAHILRIQLLDTPDAVTELRESYEMSSAQVDLVQSLFERKIADPDARIVLDDEELDVVHPSSSEGRRESAEMFEALGISFPARKKRRSS